MMIECLSNKLSICIIKSILTPDLGLFLCYILFSCFYKGAGNLSNFVGLDLKIYPVVHLRIIFVEQLQ